MLKSLSLFLLSLSIIGFSQAQKTSRSKKMEITISSSSFKDGELIPSKYTCDGSNMSPSLNWKTDIKDIKSFAIISDDPDAPSGDFVHWVIFNIPPAVRELKEDIKPNKNIPDGVLMGTNDYGKAAYGGPCPPSGTHRYFFKIYALDVILNSKAGISKKELLEAMKGHIIGKGQFIGLYKRQK